MKKRIFPLAPSPTVHWEIDASKGENPGRKFGEKPIKLEKQSMQLTFSQGLKQVVRFLKDDDDRWRLCVHEHLLTKQMLIQIQAKSTAARLLRRIGTEESTTKNKRF
jgi:hypothetical protein